MSAIVLHWQAVRQAVAAEKQRATSAIRVDETSFLPAALELVERPVSPTARTTVYVMLSGLALLILWLILGRTDIVATAGGTIVPADYVKLVQPAEAGVVRAILVHDGQRVRKGQALVLLDPTLSTADAAQARRALQDAEFAAARSRAVATALSGGGFVFTPPAGATPADVRTQESLARSQLAQAEAGIAGQNADTRAATSQVAEARVQAAKLAETLPLLDQQIAANEILLAKGFVSKLKVLDLRRQRISEARDRDSALETIRRATAQAASAGSGAARTRAEARSQALADLVRAEGDARLKREELTKSTQHSTFQALRAPTDGVVSQLAIHTIGGVVEAAKPIMTIVPTASRMIAEVKLLNRDAGFIQVGQEVAVKLEAFPYTRYGMIKGHILSLSSDAIVDDKLGPIYLARIALDRTTIARDDRTVPVLPGMTLTADIKTGTRNFMSYLISPIERAGGEAAHER